MKRVWIVWILGADRKLSAVFSNSKEANKYAESCKSSVSITCEPVFMKSEEVQ